MRIGEERELQTADRETLNRLQNQIFELLMALSRVETLHLQICLDHFDDALEQMSEHDEHFLRELVPYASFVVAIRPNMLDRHMAEYEGSSPFLNVMLLRSISVLNETEAHALIAKPAMEHGIALTLGEQYFLLEAAGRHPYLLALTCEHYAVLRQDNPQLAENVNTPEVRERILESMLAQPEIDLHLQLTWRDLPARQRRVLAQLAGQEYQIPDSHAIKSTLKALQTQALIVENLTTGHFTLFSLIFTRFVHLQPREILRADSALVEPAHLATLDRKLLEYFQQHPDQLIPTKQLLVTIWGDPEASRRGLEAAIHRLRSYLSIERGDEAEYIHTVRGRGYMYRPYPNDRRTG
ncbi:winged helix-turn-helix domain-containing protein [Scytonema tolypothrichoides VB-61278]|nr:winged helix-turn-helix domain-containing protein [Scytonema tolypothrichoides VB-61278]